MDIEKEMREYEIVVVGAGAGGLVIAIGAAKAGKKVLMIEAGHWGGDCTNFGCIPSKALIEAAHIAHAAKNGEEFGLKIDLSSFDAKGALKRTRNIVAHVRSEEDEASLQEKGVDTLMGIASFEDSHTLKVERAEGGVERILCKTIVLATGSHPVNPKIPGIEKIEALTNETVFDLKKIPESLAILGGGPIGCELGQAFQRLGSQVSIIQRHRHILKKEEPEAAEVVESAFKKEGIQLFLGYHTQKVDKLGDKIELFLCDKEKGLSHPLQVTHLLIAAGRRPSISKLNLGAAHVKWTDHGIVVDKYGRTSQKHIWAVGDVAGHALFTHIAENEARTVLKNLLVPFIFRSKQDREQSIPRCTYTDPEVASFGMGEDEAVQTYGRGRVATYFVPFSAVDRAITAGREEGFIKVVTKKWSSKILGATIVGPRAGEMIHELSLAKHNRIPLRKIASLIHPYPTYNQGVRKAADQWLTKTILPNLMKFIGKKS